MAAPSGAALQVQLSANIDKFRKQMQETGAIADKAVHDIEDKFSRANPTIGGAFGSGLLRGGLAQLLSGAGIGGLVKVLVDANREMAKLGDTAKKVGVATDKLQEIQFAGVKSGVQSSVIDATLQSIAKQLNDARRGEGELGKIFDDNNKKLRDRNGEWISVETALGHIADLMRGFTEHQDKVRLAEKLHVPEEAIALLERGGPAIKRIGEEATVAGLNISREIIDKAKEFDLKWGVAWESFSRHSRAFLGGWIFGIDEAERKAAAMIGRISTEVDKRRTVVRTGGGGTSTSDAVGELKKIAETASSATTELGRAAAGVVTEVAGAASGAATELGKVVELEKDAAAAGDDVIDKLKKIRQNLLNTPVFPSEAGAAPTLTSTMPESRQARTRTDLGPLGPPPEPFPERAAPPPPPPAPAPAPRAAPAETATTETIKQTTILRSEASEVLDKYIDGLTRQKAVEDAITATLGQSAPMRQAAIELAKASVLIDRLSGEEKERYIEKLKAEVVALEQSRMKKEAAMRAQQGINDATRFFGELTLDVFDKLIEGGAKFEDILKDIAKSIAKAALQAALLGSGPLAGLFGTGPTSAGGVGGLLGALISGFTPRAEGGSVTAGRGYMVGERGRELFVPSMNGRIVPNSVIARSGGGSSIVHNRTLNIDARGAERGVEQKIIAAIQEYDRVVWPRIQEKQLRTG